MAAAAQTAPALLTFEEYFSTTYRPDCDYVDGHLEERHVGEYEHNNLQAALVAWFFTRGPQWNVRVLPEQRTRVGPARVRVPDVCLVPRDGAIEKVRVTPPILCIEILSPEDRPNRTVRVLDEYLVMGVHNLWLFDPVERLAFTYSQPASSSSAPHHPRNRHLPRPSRALRLAPALLAAAAWSRSSTPSRPRSSCPPAPPSPSTTSRSSTPSTRTSATRSTSRSPIPSASARLPSCPRAPSSTATSPRSSRRPRSLSTPSRSPAPTSPSPATPSSSKAPSATTPPKPHPSSPGITSSPPRRSSKSPAS